MSILDLGQALEPQIRRRLVRESVTALGYDLSDERLARVAEGMRAYMDKGVPVSYAFAEALDDELLLYGDPLAREPNIKGIVH